MRLRNKSEKIITPCPDECPDDDELVNMNVKKIDQRFNHLELHEIQAIKRRRRTLKHRVYWRLSNPKVAPPNYYLKDDELVNFDKEKIDRRFAHLDPHTIQTIKSRRRSLLRNRRKKEKKNTCLELTSALSEPISEPDIYTTDNTTYTALCS